MRKEVSQEFGASGFIDAAVNFGFVVDLRVGVKAGALFDAAGFWIVCAKVEAADAGRSDDGGAGRARFKRYIEVAIGQAVGFEVLAGLADCDDFGMGAGVVMGAG